MQQKKVKVSKKPLKKLMKKIIKEFKEISKKNTLFLFKQNNQKTFRTKTLEQYATFLFVDDHPDRMTDFTEHFFIT